jgi:hypothetical protein
MNKKLICLAGLLVLSVAATFVGNAQEAVLTSGVAVLNNTTSNTTSNITSNATLNESIIEPVVPATIAETNESLASPLNASPIVADQVDTMPDENETVPAENLTSSESIASPIPVAENAAAIPGVLALGGTNLISKPAKSVYAIGSAAGTPGTFSIGKDYLPEQAYNAGMSAETIMDLSALPFYANHM